MPTNASAWSFQIPTRSLVKTAPQAAVDPTSQPRQLFRLMFTYFRAIQRWNDFVIGTNLRMKESRPCSVRPGVTCVPRAGAAPQGVEGAADTVIVDRHGALEKCSC